MTSMTSRGALPIKGLMKLIVFLVLLAALVWHFVLEYERYAEGEFLKKIYQESVQRMKFLDDCDCIKRLKPSPTDTIG